MRKIFYWIATVSLVPFISCVHDFNPIDIGMAAGDVVVNGILFQDSLPKIFLNRTQRFDALNTPDWIGEAEVLIHYKPIGSEDDMLKSQLLVFTDSFYVGSTRLEAGMEYFLAVETKDGAKITASTIIPHLQKIRTTKLIFPAGIMQTPTFSGAFTRLSMDFINPDDKSFFETFIYNIDTVFTDFPQTPFQILKTGSRDEIILKEALPSSYMYTFVFSADSSSGSIISMQFDYICCANPFFTEFHMVLQTCSEEYYLYKKSLYSHLDALQYQQNFSANDLYFPNIFRQLNPIYSNINGGRGIFAGLGMNKAQAVCNLIGNTCG